MVSIARRFIARLSFVVASAGFISVGALSVGVVGCDSPKEVAPPKLSGPATVANEEAVDEKPFREDWEAHYMHGSKIGHTRTSYRHAKLDGTPVVRIEQVGRVSVLRNDQRVEQTSRQVSWETEAGEVRRIENTMLLGDTPQIMRCVVDGKRATLSLVTGDRTQTQVLMWPEGTRGPTAIQDDLLRSPMKPGETRELSMLLPVFNKIAKVALAAKQMESIDVGRAKQELLHIDAVSTLEGGLSIKTIIWTDAQGKMLKSEYPDLGQTAIATTSAAAVAQDDSGAPAVDIGRSTMVKIAPPFVDAHAKTSATYRLTLPGDDSAELLPNCESQTVKKLSDGGYEVVVTALRPDTPLPTGYVVRVPTASDLTPNTLVESDDQRIIVMARNAVGNETDVWGKAKKLEAYVRQIIRTKEFSPAFGTASETAKSLTGDCTEFSVLLCAMLRSRGIPARSAIGLVYVEKEEAFVYHMWTEAYIGTRWIGLDATRGAGGLSAAYLKIADMNFEGADPYAGLLRIFGVIGRLKVEVVEAK